MVLEWPSSSTSPIRSVQGLGFHGPALHGCLLDKFRLHREGGIPVVASMRPGQRAHRRPACRCIEEVQTNRIDSAAFLAALTIPENPLPRRKEITDIGVRRTAELLRMYRSSTSGPYADACYRELVRMIAAAGTDVPGSETDPSPPIAATLDQILSSRANKRLMQKYLPADHILKSLLRTFDQQSAASLPDAGQQGWEPDTHFTGRSLPGGAISPHGARRSNRDSASRCPWHPWMWED